MRVLAIVMILLPACGMAHAVEIDALISTAIKAATDELLPPFERANGHTIRHKSALFGHRQRFFARKPILLPAVPMPGTALGSRRNVRGAGLARHWGATAQLHHTPTRPSGRTDGPGLPPAPLRKAADGPRPHSGSRLHRQRG